MALTKCGFDSGSGGHGCDLLISQGPTIFVHIGFDPNFKSSQPTPPANSNAFRALVDTGATECCIDSLLAQQLRLPIVDRRKIGGVGGAHEVNLHLAQVHIPALGHVMHGAFAGVHLAAGGQRHVALLGRTFLSGFTMTYEGRTGTVVLSSD